VTENGKHEASNDVNAAPS